MQALESVTVELEGLGPLNQVGAKVILGIVQQNITNLLLSTGREIFRQIQIFLKENRFHDKGKTILIFANQNI